MHPTVQVNTLHSRWNCSVRSSARHHVLFTTFVENVDTCAIGEDLVIALHLGSSEYSQVF